MPPGFLCRAGEFGPKGQKCCLGKSYLMLTKSVLVYAGVSLAQPGPGAGHAQQSCRPVPWLCCAAAFSQTHALPVPCCIWLLRHHPGSCRPTCQEPPGMRHAWCPSVILGLLLLGQHGFKLLRSGKCCSKGMWRIKPIPPEGGKWEESLGLSTAHKFPPWIYEKIKQRLHIAQYNEYQG